MIYQVFIAFVTVFATAIVLDAPKHLNVYIGLLGALGWLCYLSLIKHSNYMLATYLSGVVIAFVSHLGARKFKVPVTIFFIPSFFPLVPGAKMYQAVYAYLTNNPEVGNTYLIETLIISGMIALAILTIDSLFRIYFQNIKRQKN